jgi:hypothetical protein
VNQVLPPLSEWDEVKLYVVLPLLAAVIRNPGLQWKTLENDTPSTLMSMVQDLARFIASPDHVAHSRSAAASCLFSIIVNNSEVDESDDNNDDKRTIPKLLVDVISPVLAKAITGLNKEVGDSLAPREPLHTAFRKFEECLGLMSVLVSCTAKLIREFYQQHFSNCGH